MAKATSITLDVNISITDETICRCLRILEMWMDDHPNDRIVVDRIATDRGFRHKASIERPKENSPK